MGFNSSIFLVWFLPVFLLIYYSLGKRIKNSYLLFASVIIYAWSEPQFVIILLITTCLDFVLVNQMHLNASAKLKKVFLITSISINLGLLFYFKYCNFFLDSINKLFNTDVTLLSLILPLGISFYTFETITYVVDVYREVHPPQKKLGNYMLYIFMFPKMIAGPIIRYHEIGDQLTNRDHSETLNNRLNGFYRFCIGLAKKVLIANQLYMYGVGAIFYVDPSTLHGSTAWLGLLGFTLQIYFDFSAYSDMAIGLGKMMGFRFPENFDSPFISESITEFWQRWHITLGNWMKNYLYIPIGGNRMGKVRMYFNLWIVFLLSGLWHKAAWHLIIWGVLHGLLIVCDKIFLIKVLKGVPGILKVLLTFSLIMISLVFFKIDSLEDCIKFYEALLYSNKVNPLDISPEFWIPLSIAIIFSFINYYPIGKKIQNYFYEDSDTLKRHFPLTILSLILFTLSLSFNTRVGLTPFIYFRF